MFFSYSFFPNERFATMDTRELDNAPASALTLPPPGAGLSEETSLEKVFIFRSISLSNDIILFSTIEESWLNSEISLSPKESIAISIISVSGMAVDLFCFRK